MTFTEGSSLLLSGTLFALGDPGVSDFLSLKINSFASNYLTALTLRYSFIVIFGNT